VEAPAGADRRPRLAWLLLALILALSAWLQFTVVAQTEVAAPLRADASDYFAYVQNLHDLGVYSRAPRWREPGAVATPDYLRPPGYPVFLRLVGGLPEASFEWLHRIALWQAALGVLTVACCFLLASEFLATPMALFATLLCAVNPWLATSNAYLLTESLFTLLLFAATWLSIRALRPESNRRLALAAGLAWALCSLVRPTTQFFLPMLCVGALAIPLWRRWRREALLGLLVFALAMAPWVLRNARLPASAGQPDLMVLSIVHGSYPDFRYEGREDTFGYPYRYDPASDAASRDLGSALRHVASRFAAHPFAQARWYLLGKPYFFLSLQDVQSFDIEVFPLNRTPYYERFEFAMLRIGTRALHAPLAVLGVFAMALLAFAPARLRMSPEARHAASLVALLIAYAIALHMLAAPFPRYAVPFRPMLYALALLPLQAAWAAWRARASARVAAA